MKEFDLEAAKAGKKVMTRNGLQARIICFDRERNLDDRRPLIVLVKFSPFSEEKVVFYGEDGRTNRYKEYDLVMAAVEHEGYVNIYENGSERVATGIYKNEEIAIKCQQVGHIATIKIKWDE